EIVLYESERKRFYEGRTTSGAAISATRRRRRPNWARAVSSSKRRSFHANEPDVGPNERKGELGAGAYRRFHARKSCADYSRRARSRNRHWPGHPLRRSQRTQTRNRGGVAVWEIQLERSFAAVSLAAVQIGPRKIGRCHAKRR